MSVNLQWLTEVRKKYFEEGVKGEDLRHDDLFIQLKNENVAVSPNAQWMLEASASLLMKSPDLRVCMYRMNALAILKDLEGFSQTLCFYADLLLEKYGECYPEGDKQKLATFDWCVKSHIANHFKDKTVSSETRTSMDSSLTKVQRVFEAKTGEVLKWRSLIDWLGNQETKPQTPKALISEVKQSPTDTGTLDETKSLVDKYIRQLLREGKFNRAVALARAQKWSDFQIPENQNGRTNLSIRQSSITEIQSYMKACEWKEVLLKSEILFMESQAHFCFSLSHWSYLALNELGFSSAAENILHFLIKLYKNDGQLFALMYNEGQLFCEPETLVWIEQHAQTRSPAVVSTQNDVMQLLNEQDVEKLKCWQNEHPTITKIDAYLHDLIHLKLSKQQRKDLSLVCASEALFERSIDENLHAWNPELARSIWNFHAGLLKEEKQKNKNNNTQTIWQAQWDRFSSLIARAHLPAALELMKYI